MTRRPWIWVQLLRVARAEAHRWWRLGQEATYAPDYCQSQRALWRGKAAAALAELRRGA